MRALRGLFVLCLSLAMLASCASVESGPKMSTTDSARRKFSRARPPSPEQLSLGMEWSCYPCLIRDRMCTANMVKIIVMAFDDIYVVHPRTVEDRDGTRVSGQAFMFRGLELMSDARGDNGVSYLRYDAFTDNLLLFNDNGWDAVQMICEDPKPPLHFWDPISS